MNKLIFDIENWLWKWKFKKVFCWFNFLGEIYILVDCAIVCFKSVVILRIIVPKTYFARVSYLPLPKDPNTGKPVAVSSKGQKISEEFVLVFISKKTM